MGKNFRESLNEQLNDPEFKAEWDALAAKRDTLRGEYALSFGGIRNPYIGKLRGQDLK